MSDDGTSRCEACIVAFRPHPTKKNRLIIACNDEPWKEIDLVFFQSQQGVLEACQEIKELEKKFTLLEFQQARLYGIRRISQQALPKQALVRALSLRLISPETIQKVITDFCARGYLNDQEWTRQFVASQLRKNLGPRAIAQKLSFKGIGKKEIEASLTFAGVVDHQEEGIRQLLATRYRSRDLKNPKERQKVIASLARRGFQFEAILNIIKE